jgi:hypothetical protein
MFFSSNVCNRSKKCSKFVCTLPTEIKGIEELKECERHPTSSVGKCPPFVYTLSRLTRFILNNFIFGANVGNFLSFHMYSK